MRLISVLLYTSEVGLLPEYWWKLHLSLLKISFQWRVILCQYPNRITELLKNYFTEMLVGTFKYNNIFSCKSFLSSKSIQIVFATEKNQSFVCVTNFSIFLVSLTWSFPERITVYTLIIDKDIAKIQSCAT